MPLNITYEYTAHRLTSSATALLTRGNMVGGTPPNSNIIPPGWYKGTAPSYHNRGHLIGNRLGGSGDEVSNIVTLTSGTNHPVMFEFEDAVFNYVSKHNGSYRYRVECIYQGYDSVNIEGKTFLCAASNIFCIYPAPASLKLSLFDIAGNRFLTLQELINFLPNHAELPYHYARAESIEIPNGVYKNYRTIRNTVIGDVYYNEFCNYIN